MADAAAAGPGEGEWPELHDYQSPFRAKPDRAAASWGMPVRRWCNWLFARQSCGRFLLRLDDTDRERSRADFAAAIETDLRWLGLGWDEYERQSARLRPLCRGGPSA